MLAAHAKFACRLDGVDGVLRAVGQANHLGARVLGLQDEGGEVAGVERVAHIAQHLAAVGLDDVAGVFFQRVAKGVVHRQEVPGFVTPRVSAAAAPEAEE